MGLRSEAPLHPRPAAQVRYAKTKEVDEFVYIKGKEAGTGEELC